MNDYSETRPATGAHHPDKEVADEVPRGLAAGTAQAEEGKVTVSVKVYRPTNCDCKNTAPAPVQGNNDSKQSGSGHVVNVAKKK